MNRTELLRAIYLTELLRAIYLDLADDPEHGHEGWELDGRHTSYGTWRVPTDPVELVYFAVFDPNLVRRKQKEEPMKAHPHAENSKPKTWIDKYAQLIDGENSKPKTWIDKY